VHGLAIARSVLKICMQRQGGKPATGMSFLWRIYCRLSIEFLSSMNRFIPRSISRLSIWVLYAHGVSCVMACGMRATRFFFNVLPYLAVCAHALSRALLCQGPAAYRQPRICVGL